MIAKMSFNKFYQQQNETADSLRDSTDRVGVEIRDNIECYVNETQIFTPSSPVPFSPDYDYERATQNQKISADNSDEVAVGLDWRHHNRLLSTCSPTSSQSSNSDIFIANDPKLREQSITNVKDFHRVRTSFSNGKTETFSGDPKKEKQDQFHQFAMQSPNNFPRRAPGFPKRVFLPPNESGSCEADHSSLQSDFECTDDGKVFEEFFSPQQQQQFQQHKLLEFQQRSKRQQVEKVIPLDDLANFESLSQQSSASYIGQRLAALKQIQQKNHYEHQLQQQYENRSIFEDEACSSDHSFRLPENENTEDNLNELIYYGRNISKSFTLSPETADSNSGDFDSDYSLRFISSNLNLKNDPNRALETLKNINGNSMPVVEDGLSSEHGSDSENNNVGGTSSINKMTEALSKETPQKQIDTRTSDYEHESQVQFSSKKIREANMAHVHKKEKPQTFKSLSEMVSEDNNNVYASKESVASTYIAEIKPKTEDDEADTDLETDRLLGEQRKFELQQGILEKNKNIRTIRCANGQVIRSPKNNIKKTQTFIRQGVGTQSPEPIDEAAIDDQDTSTSSSKSQPIGLMPNDKINLRSNKDSLDPTLLIEGILFRARYLGTTQLVCEGKPTKSLRMTQAEEAVGRIKAPEGESQPSTEVDLFVSTEKVMVLNTDMKEMMMDHPLKSISYIADIGDLVVLMARRKVIHQDHSDSTLSIGGNANRTPKMICHVFESEEAQFIAQSIGQAFQVAYMEFLKANGIEDHSFMKEMDYQEVLNSQEIFGDELKIFAKKELQKEVVVPKAKGEILGVVIVESGWGSMLPTVVIANLASNGAAARCGQLNIGDQIIAINGLSLVGLPLSQCQTYIRNAKSQTAVKFTVVPCAPVVEVKIKRPNTKYQLGFSVQNGVICSLLRGGIAERGGVRVGHRIIEINNQSVVAVPHEKIVALLATSVGEILMKTMPTSMFRLLTGQENPIYI